MAFRLLDQLPQYTDSLGALCAGGSLTFTISGGTTAKPVFAEPALSTNLGNIIELDSDARHSEDLWLAEDVAYRVVLKTSAGTTVWTRDNVRALDQTVSAALPAADDGNDGEALFTDGTPGGWYFDTIRQVPDPTGHAGEKLVTDGEAIYWEADAVEEEDTGVSATSSGYLDFMGVRMVWGTDTAPSAAALTTTKAVTFTNSLGGAPWHVSVTPNISSGVTSNSPPGRPNASWSNGVATGFTAGFFVGEENTGGTDVINASIPFTYMAIGPAP